MSTQDRPFIAVIGGLWQLKSPQLDAAKAEGRKIGEQLAKAGFGLVVYFSDEASLEPHVVTGYVAALGGSEGSIQVHFASSQRDEVHFPEEDSAPSGLFQRTEHPSDKWEAAFYWSLAAESGVDAVLLLSGNDSVFLAGTIAVARRIPLLIVNKFGGSADTIWRQLPRDPAGNPPPPWGAAPAEAMLTNLKQKCAATKQQREQGRAREELLQSLLAQHASKRLHQLWTAGSSILLLMTLFLGLVYIPYPAAYAYIMLLGLIPAGATGALARPLVWPPIEKDPWESFLLGALAGLIVGVAYLIPQFVGHLGSDAAPDSGDVLTDAVTKITGVNKIEFLSAFLVAFSAGVGFDTVFTRLRKRADEIEIAPQKP